MYNGFSQFVRQYEMVDSLFSEVEKQDKTEGSAAGLATKKTADEKVEQEPSFPYDHIMTTRILLLRNSSVIHQHQRIFENYT